MSVLASDHRPRRSAGVPTIALSGELDLFTAPLAEDALDEALAARPRNLVVDLVDVTYVDSKALGFLLRAQRLLADAGGSIVLVAAGETVDAVLRLLGLEDLFEVVSVREQALRAA